MAREIEAKKLDVNVLQVVQQLKEIGARHLGTKKQRRYVYDINPNDPSTWMRLRTDGEVTTLTVKKIHDDGIDGTEEWETEVDSFEHTHEMLEAMGFRAKAYQENIRSSYSVPGVQIEIDAWPKIPPYVEIEAFSAEHVHEIGRALGWAPEDLTSENTTKVYARYGIDLASVKDLRF